MRRTGSGARTRRFPMVGKGSRSARRTGGARAFTLLEVMFALVITAAVFGVLYQLWYAETNRNIKLEAKTAALQSALVASRRIEADLERLVTVPLARDADGMPVRRYGDFTAPVAISSRGKSISFYIPAYEGEGSPPSADLEIPCRTVTYSLKPAERPGVYRLYRMVFDDPAALEEFMADPEHPEKFGKPVGGGSLYLSDIHFRLISPVAENPENRSSDLNFYVEVYVEGTDELGKEHQVLTSLVRLDEPSMLFRVPAQAQTSRHRAKTRLYAGRDLLNPSPQDQEAMKKLDELADDLRNGRIPPREFEDEIKELINRYAGKPEGAVFSGGGPMVPKVDRVQLASVPKPHEPIVVKSDNDTFEIPPAAPAKKPSPSSSSTKETHHWKVWGSTTVMYIDGSGKVRYRSDTEFGGEGGGESPPDFNDLMGDLRGSMERQINQEVTHIMENLMPNNGR